MEGMTFADEVKAVTPRAPRAALLVIGALALQLLFIASCFGALHNHCRCSEAPVHGTVTDMPYDAHSCSHLFRLRMLTSCLSVSRPVPCAAYPLS
jgi:hypothetical protein